jgi:cytochrome aa3-600 menaquinol oxidase subunit 2
VVPRQMKAYRRALRSRTPRRRLLIAVILATGLLTTGCGPQYVLLHPAGPVAAKELHLFVLAGVAMGIVIVSVFALYAVTVIRFRDRPGNRAPYMPNWHGHRILEPLWFIVPAILLTVIAIPTVGVTYELAHLPKARDPVVIDVTSLQWKWLFEYPQQHIATVNYIEIPTGEPVLFELTAESPMNTFWVPQLGGMEYTMPGRVLPLWLQASQPGVYWGHSGNFSGVGFAAMYFHVRAVSPAKFRAWARTMRHTKAPMTLADYHRLLDFTVVGDQTYGAYPLATFPHTQSGFVLQGGMYMPMANDPRKS